MIIRSKESAEFDNRLLEAATDAIAHNYGLRERGLYPGGVNVSNVIEYCKRSMAGTVRGEVDLILKSDKRDAFIAKVQQKLRKKYGV